MPDTPVTWRNQFTVNTTTTGAQTDPDVMQLANGNILVSWTTTDTAGLGSPTGTETFGQIFDPLGNKVGGEIRLNNASTVDNEQNADLAPLPNGGFIVVYHDLDEPSSGGGSNIRLEEYDANGVRVTDNSAVVVDSGAGSDPNYQNPVVAVSSATSVLIAYEEVSAGASKIVGKIYNTTTDTYGAQFDIMSGGANGGTRDADVAVLSNGNYVITGNRGDADNSIVYRIVNSTGANVVGATFVSSTNTNTENDREASVTALTGGGFVIAFTNTDTSDTDVQFFVYNNAGTQTGSGAVDFFGSSTNNNNEPKVIALADGTFVIAYDNDEVTGVNVQHFSATGGALGVPFVVSTNNADNISGTTLADGRFALVWDFAGGEIQMEILDTRDAVNNPVYTPDQWQVGTINGDSFTANNTTEIVHGGQGDDFITAVNVAGVQQYFGDEGNDTIVVKSAITDDVYDGGTGTDTVNWSTSGAANGGVYNLQIGTAVLGLNTEQMRNFENFVGSAADDLIIGSTAANNLNGFSGNDFIIGGAGGDTLVGGTGFDSVSWFNEASGATVNLMNQSLTAGSAVGDTAAGFEAYYMTNFGDNFTNDNLGGFIYGFNGNDILTGGTGSDFIDGGVGGDTINTGTGFDYVSYSNAAAGVRVDMTNAATNTGEAAGDTIVGAEAFYLSAQGDTFIGQTGQNFVFAGGGTDNLFGGANSSDWLFGEAGADFLSGGNFDDLLSGGTGNDTYAFTSWVGNGFDSILDFTPGADKIQLTGSGFSLIAGQPLVNGVNFVSGAAPVATGAQATVFYNTTLGIILFDADGTGGAFGQVQLAQISGAPALTAGDFLIV